MRRPDPRGLPPSALESASFWGRAPVRADGGVRAAAEAGHTGAGELARPGLEMAALDSRNRMHDHSAAALEILWCQHLLAILLEPRGLPDAEDVLSHVSPDPILRVPERQKSRLKPQRFALVVNPVPACEVIEGELHVRHLRAEVLLVCVFHRLARTRLVVDDLDLAVAHVIDPVDLADDLHAIELEVESPLDVERSQAPDHLQARDELDVVAEHCSDLHLLALAVEHPFHARQVGIEMLYEGCLQPFTLQLRGERPPLRLVQVEVLEHLVEKTAPLHRDRARLINEARMVVVPVEARTLQVIVQRGRAEVIDLDLGWVSIRAVRFKGLA